MYIFEAFAWSVLVCLISANPLPLPSNSSQILVHRHPVTDPYWALQWYVFPEAQDARLDHNIKGAWDLGYTGKGVVVTIVDDGIEWSHPDLAPNYDRQASWDYQDGDDDPKPVYDVELHAMPRRGTMSAGVVAAAANNTECVVGIAHKASIGGIRIPKGLADEAEQNAANAAALLHNTQHIHIYSWGWTTADDAQSISQPGRLMSAAMLKGVEEGRRGLGSVYVVTSGNGGKRDSCSLDGVASSRYTISISAATEHGHAPHYGERCPSTLATAYSGGRGTDRSLASVDTDGCTKGFSGTAASTALASGIIALTLEANPSLTWRDLQNIIVRTARPGNLQANDWQVNGVGRSVSHSFGYGLLDAEAMVSLAKRWYSSKALHTCTETHPLTISQRNGTTLELRFDSTGCEGTVSYLEHVEAVISMSAPQRGEIQMHLIAPSGTRSTLLTKRRDDHSSEGFVEWPFMTTHSWGESPSGQWVLQVELDDWEGVEVTKWELRLYGTAEKVTEPSKEQFSVPLLGLFSWGQILKFLADAKAVFCGGC